MSNEPNEPTRSVPPAGPTRTSPDHSVPDQPDAATAALTRPVGPVLADRYQVVRPIGEGGMGTVYLAFDGELGREVAIKVLPGERAASADTVKRFRREAQALARLSHPGIVQAFDVGEHDGRPFLVMEYVPGVNLADRLRSAGPLPPARAADAAHQAAAALAYAHEKGLIHRDVKPGNLIVTPEGRVKLLDLGLARFLQDHAADPTKTREGAGMGTPDYAAPEQFRDARSADPRSDVYALGCTLYHLVGGRVPFPGTSLTEKLDAHETRDPTPLEELAPDVPLGLALAARKMMAKRPADRFQSAREVADALAPFVAGGASTVSVFARTAVWDGSQLRSPSRHKRGRWPAVVGIAAGLLVAALALAGAHQAGWVRFGDNPEVAQGPPDQPGPTEPPKNPGPAVRPGETPPGVPADPNVLTVSQKPEGGGTYRTIDDALAAVKPGQTVRVLDDEVYPEPVFLSRPSQHAGVTLEAARGAILAPPQKQAAILIRGVPGVTVRGFRLRADAEGLIMAAIIHSCPGAALEDLDILPGRTTPSVGVSLENLDLPEGAPPVVVRRCRIRRAHVGIQVRGVDRDYRTSRPSRRVVLRDNRVESPGGGINLVGDLRQVQVVGNVVIGAGLGGIQLENLFETTDGLLIANNTVSESDAPIRLWDDRTKGVLGTNVQFRNNLIVAASGPEVVYKHALDSVTPRGYGDGAAVAAKWSFGHNWRESDSDPMAEGSVPPGKTDVRLPMIGGIDRDPKSPNYLRPAKDSPLATKGAGTEDPTLPRYVGALPPQGVDPWDWDRTWRMPRDAQLLTVSKDEKDGGQYRTIADALNEAKPWATIRVLDAGPYHDKLLLREADRHTGVTLEAVNGAVLEGRQAGMLVEIRNVPSVTVRGFRLRAEGAERSTLLAVLGRSPGVVLNGLTLEADGGMNHNGLELVSVPSPADRPTTVRNCRFTGCGMGIAVAGFPTLPVERVVVRDCSFEDGNLGVKLIGTVRHVQVTGNRFRGTIMAAVQFDSLAADSENLLVANNTCIGCGSGFRIWGLVVNGRGVRIRNNLWLASTGVDAAFFLPGDVNPNVPKGAGDVTAAASQYRWGFNYREGVRPDSDQGKPWIPPGPNDTRQDRIDGIDRDPKSPSFLRPAKDSPLATKGAGVEDPALPRYVGAIPPEGIAPWDWDRTWRWTMAGPPPEASKPPEKTP